MTTGPPQAKGLTVLIVEDEFLIALDLQDTLQSAGYGVMGPARRVAEALELLKGSPPPDVALLDVNLCGERVTPVARLLNVMGIPFLLTTAGLNFGADIDGTLSSAENEQADQQIPPIERATAHGCH